MYSDVYFKYMCIDILSSNVFTEYKILNNILS